MRALGIDPGPNQSGVVLLVDGRVEDSGVVENQSIRERLRGNDYDLIAIEQIRSYGMAVGAEVFDTCVEVGRFFECSRWPPILVPRMDVKMHLCHSPRAKDKNIRQALIDRFGSPGTKKAPGALYGVSRHAWAALAVAVTAMDQLESRS